MSSPGHVLVVGASAAGLGTAEALRRKGYQGRLTLLGAESGPPYDRPPLSKQVLSGAWEPDKARLRPQDALDGLDAAFVLGDPAVSLDAARRRVETASGRTLTADAVVVATGVRARPLPGPGGLRGVHVVRTLDDSAALRADLVAARRLVVVGDGVLGAEAAATARLMGLEVCVVGPQPSPMTDQLGPFAAGHLAALHTRNGVVLRGGTLVESLLSREGRVAGVRLVGGEELEADVVVAAIGCTPATDWLTGSGLELDDGVVCDAYCRAADGVWAAGDVARWHHAGVGRPMRLENRANATEQALAVAGNILGENRPYLPVPSFWTDQFQVKIQVLGTPTADTSPEVVDGDPAQGRFVVRYDAPEGPTGVLGWNMPKQTRLHRAVLTDRFTRPPEPAGR
ncbi:MULTISPECIES: NAD(P)/FAD-dependent oxidoreductase [Streptomyces]|uniref:NAD(P)/FAD-dependent oxidoreductase n=1 Tax=Streptomyces flavovirens TaxID=52258 RepID=A0ABV8MYM0_9ACTN|nr:FAD-dependent oxidoreductase [Streptomyces sp. MBT51]MBK3597120.1 FAD-dependent oxidoreductase [Streptomyces sp. MBT51]